MDSPPSTIRRDTRVFISAVTRELGSMRKLVKKGLEDNDYHPVEQDSFPPDYRDLKDKLRAGSRRATPWSTSPGIATGPNRSTGLPSARRSYTQLEYDIAADLGKPVYVFLTGADFPADPHDPEPAELHQLQQAHRQRLTSTGQDYNPVEGSDQLDQKIRSLQIKVERLTDELQQVDRQVAVTGGRLRGWLIAVAILGIAALGTVGYVEWRQQLEHRAQVRERAEQERERIAAEAAQGSRDGQAGPEGIRRTVPPATPDQQGDQGRGSPAACRLKELPALVKLPMAEIGSLIDRKIPSESPVEPGAGSPGPGEVR